MNWTDETPTETGYYWCRDPHNRKPFIVHMNVMQDTPAPGYEWAGPIHPPL